MYTVDLSCRKIPISQQFFRNMNIYLKLKIVSLQTFGTLFINIYNMQWVENMLERMNRPQKMRGRVKVSIGLY